MITPVHPGVYIRETVLPKDMHVNEAAKLLNVSRPTLSKLLNKRAALSVEMAARLEKAFGADQKKLLKLQADFDLHQKHSTTQKLAVGAYVPPFLKITAKQIEQWADRNQEARSLLPVLLRKLVNSTGQDLTLVDFPGYDQAERKGWDGRVDASVATPWIPIGQSRWEFGCSQNPRQKAIADYAARVRAIPPKERADIHFVFVTPRIWNSKEKWREEMEALGEWKSVRAYDAGDLEQWLEQSLPAQRWLSEKVGIPFDGVFSIEDCWHEWASGTDPELSKELFIPSIEHFKDTVKRWIENSSPSPLVVAGDSKLEALGFLHCLFEEQDPAFTGMADRLLVFNSGQALRKLTTATPPFVPVVYTDAAERELGASYKGKHIIIVRPRNTVDPEPSIILDQLRHEPFRKALEVMGFDDHLKIDELGRKSGYSPTILRRLLSSVPAISTPEWAKDSTAVRRLIPMMLVGTWHTQSTGDCEIMHVLAGRPCDEIEKDVVDLLKFDDPPVWSVGKFRGVASKIDALYAAQASVTPKDLTEFMMVAEIVLSEDDPALQLPEDQRVFAALYGKSREHSSALRDGICETLVLLAVHGPRLFDKRLGLDVDAMVSRVIRDLLTPLTPKKLLSQTDSLPLYAEAAPHEFIRIIEDDLRSADPQLYSLMTPARGGLFSSCPRTGLLWALENLAWSAETLPRACLILAKLAQLKINDNWGNKPGKSLEAIFRCWMPQTAASLEDRIKTLKTLTQKFPDVGWEICLAQFVRGTRVGGYNHRPRWRSDASGAGLPLKTWGEIREFARKALDLALSWAPHDERTLGDLVSNVHGLARDDEKAVWDRVESWARTQTDEGRRAILRETIRRSVFVSRHAEQSISPETKSRARRAYDVLAPTDPVTQNQWLFEQQWVEMSMDEDESEESVFDFQKREDKIKKLRIEALQEIWTAKGYEGIQKLLAKSGAAFTVGWCLAEGVITSAQIASFLEYCLKVEDPLTIGKFDEAMRGFLLKIDAHDLTRVTRQLAKALPPSQYCRLLKCSPFQSETWAHVSESGEAIREQYWREVTPDHLKEDSSDLNESVDRLLDAKRPRAALYSVEFALGELETSRLKRLLLDCGTCDSETHGTYQIHGYHLSQALDILQKRSGVTEDEMARLEFLFLGALEHEPHGIPNLEKQIGESPALFAQFLAVAFRRRDGAEDPPELRVEDQERAAALAQSVYRLLQNIRRIPGTADSGKIDEKTLRAWVKEAQTLCARYGRVEIGNQMIGAILAQSKMGTDGIWPCEEVRRALEDCATSEVEIGFRVGVLNSRGVYARGEGGSQERELAERYENWSRQLVFDYPYVARVLKGIAQEYAQEAAREDYDSAVRRRLRH